MKLTPKQKQLVKEYVNINLKKIPFKYDEDKRTFYISEKDVQFATEYTLISPIGKKVTFKFTHSTGPEFDPNTSWIYISDDKKYTLNVANDIAITAANAKAYLNGKLKAESKQFSLAEVARKILKESDNDSRTFEDNCEILQKFESEDKLYSKEAREILQDAHELTEDELNDAVNDLMKQYRLSDPRINKKPDHRRPNPWDRDYRDGDFR